MKKSAVERQIIWDEFLKVWPLERLHTMSIQEYSEASTNSSFCYWLESMTDEIGSIWGGSAFKFGVYARLDKSDAENGRGRCYTDEYGWMEKYGAKPEEAFDTVRSIIVQIAEAARQNDLSAVEKLDFGDAMKWKLAFLYQNPSQISVIPIFKPEYIKLLLINPPISIAACHNELLTKINSKSIFEFASELWEKIQIKLSEQATPDRAFTYLDGSSHYQLIKTHTKYIAGFSTKLGKQLALTMTGKKIVMYVQPGDWQNKLHDDSLKFLHYDKNKPRNSNIDTNTPNLATGKKMLKVSIINMDSFVRFCEAYRQLPDGTETKMDRENLQTSNEQQCQENPLNQILYGPPGTGKTYHSIEVAVKAAEPRFVWYDDRALLKAEYDRLVLDKRIRFVTFHQSYGYEEFVEGLKARETDSGDVTYVTENGVFKGICDDAALVEVDADSGINRDGRVWKLSIEGTKANPAKTYCLENNIAAIGWGDTGDLTGEKRNEYFLSQGKNNQNSLIYFSQEMTEGDIVLCINSNTSVEAIGVVTGEYKYQEEGLSSRSDYRHQMPIKWLAKGFSVDFKALNHNKQFNLPTCYPLSRLTVSDALKHLTEHDVTITYSRPKTNHNNYVLIIDEINRGNISKIFGELITLIEPSKRLCKENEEALTLTLPHSGKSFSVPNNLYIIGTMNTADRSLALMDTALRRRFDFVEMMPDYQVLSGAVIKLGAFEIDLANLLKTMNERIEVLYDREHTLGHAFFIPVIDKLKNDENEFAFAELCSVFKNKIIPLLQEYFSEDWNKIRLVLGDNQKETAKLGELVFIGEKRCEYQAIFGNNHGLDSYEQEN